MIKNIKEKIRKEFKKGKCKSPKDISKKLNIEYSYACQLLKLCNLKFKRESKYEEMVGKSFGSLLVMSIKVEKERGFRGRAFCKCLNCGNKKWINCYNLIDGTTKSCGCLSRELQAKSNSGSKTYNFKGFKKISGCYWKRILESASRRGLSVDITIQDIWERFLKQKEKCNLSGAEICFPKTNSEKGTASLDRINSSKGYTKDNIQWVHKDVNGIKNNFEQNYFLECCKKIYLHKTLNALFEVGIEDLKPNRKKGIQWKGLGEISGTYWCRVRSSRIFKRIKSDLTIEDAWNIFLSQNGYCALSGIKIYFGSKNNTASLDRIDSSKGYTKDNVQWVHKDINCLKRDMDEAHLLNICKNIYIEQQKRKSI